MKKQQKRKFSFLDIALLVATFALTIASIYFLYLYKNDTPKKKTTTQEVLNSSVEEIASSYPGITIVNEFSNDPSKPFAIQYPKSDYQRFNDLVKKHIEIIKYAHLSKIAAYDTEDTSTEVPLENELNISFETFEHPANIYSFVIVTNAYVGDQAGELNIRTFQLNYETGEMYSLQNIFKNPYDTLDTLANLAREKISQDQSLAHFSTETDILKHTEADWENYKHFALTEDALVLYLTHFQVDQNFPLISIPYAEIKDILKDSFYFAQEDQEEEDLAEEVIIDEEDGSSTTEDMAQVPSSEASAEVEEDNDTKHDISSKNDDITPLPQMKRVALTFDDGPDPKVTPRILNILKKYDAKATFFMLGNSVQFYPEVAKMVQEDGHEIGNHSWNHPNLTKMSNEKIHSEIHNTSKIIEEVTGVNPLSFRPPYGAVNDRVRAQTNLPVVLWDVDTLDWKHRNPQQLLAYVKQQTKDGSNILMHDIHASTADGLDAVLAYLVENGYHFVTVSELNK